MNETFNPGDRVTIQGVRKEYERQHLGRAGRLQRLSPFGFYMVEADGPVVELVAATSVERETP